MSTHRYETPGETARRLLARHSHSEVALSESAPPVVDPQDMESVEKSISHHRALHASHFEHARQAEQTALQNLKDGNTEAAEYWIREHKKHSELSTHHGNIADAGSRAVEATTAPIVPDQPIVTHEEAAPEPSSEPVIEERSRATKSVVGRAMIASSKKRATCEGADPRAARRQKIVEDAVNAWLRRCSPVTHAKLNGGKNA